VIPVQDQLRLTSLETLSRVFPHKKRAVLELVLRRCGHDLLRAIEHFVRRTENGPAAAVAAAPAPIGRGGSAFSPPLSSSMAAPDSPPAAHQSLPFLAPPPPPPLLFGEPPFLAPLPPLLLPSTYRALACYLPGCLECARTHHLALKAHHQEP
jgi:doublesex- and mab-3-related transcription factor 4/5